MIRPMNAELFSATILLILVIDPFGNVPLVVATLKNVAPKRRVAVEMLPSGVRSFAGELAK